MNIMKDGLQIAIVRDDFEGGFYWEDAMERLSDKSFPNVEECIADFNRQLQTIPTRQIHIVSDSLGYQWTIDKRQGAFLNWDGLSIEEMLQTIALLIGARLGEIRVIKEKYADCEILGVAYVLE